MFCVKIKYREVLPACISASKVIFILFIAFSAQNCSNLVPDDADLRGHNSAAVLNVGQVAPEFSLPVTDGSVLTLASSLSEKDAVVFYFTMWCSVCTSHSDEIVQSIVPSFSRVRFVVVDYVSPTIHDAATLKNYGGYDSVGIDVVLDKSQHFMNSYGATMASVVIIDSAQKIRMNETYKKSRITNLLGSL